MRVVPHGAREDDFDFLSAGQAGDLVVVGDLRVEADVFEVLRDDLRLEDAEAEALARGLVVVEFLDQFAEAPFEERFARDLAVVLGEHVSPFARDECQSRDWGGKQGKMETYTSYWNVFLYF